MDNITSANNQTWRYKFRTPRKDKKKKHIEDLFSDVNTKEDSRKSDDIDCLPRHLFGGWKSKSKLEKVQKITHKRGKTIQVSYYVMRSIVTAIHYIEMLGGLQQPSLYSNFFEGAAVLSDVKEKVEELAQSILNKWKKKKEVELNDFVSMSDNVNIVAEGVLFVLQKCEPLVPNGGIFESIMNIKEGVEVEKYLSSQSWTVEKSLLFIIICHHLAKLSNFITKLDEGESLLKIIAERFAIILFQNDSTRTHYKDSMKREVMLKIIHHFSKDLFTNIHSDSQSVKIENNGLQPKSTIVSINQKGENVDKEIDQPNVTENKDDNCSLQKDDSKLLDKNGFDKRLVNPKCEDDRIVTNYNNIDKLIVKAKLRIQKAENALQML